MCEGGDGTERNAERAWRREEEDRGRQRKKEQEESERQRRQEELERELRKKERESQVRIQGMEREHDLALQRRERDSPTCNAASEGSAVSGTSKTSPHKFMPPFNKQRDIVRVFSARSVMSVHVDFSTYAYILGVLVTTVQRLCLAQPVSMHKGASRLLNCCSVHALKDIALTMRIVFWVNINLSAKEKWRPTHTSQYEQVVLPTLTLNAPWDL